MTTASDDPTNDLPPEHPAAAPPPPDRDPDEGGDAASDVKQFLDIDPPESPATDADIPAPPG